MTNAKTIPASALLIGGGGLLPFAAGAAILFLGLQVPLLGPPAQVQWVLIVYAVAILSFLGGVRWGIAMGLDDAARAARDYVLAVLPALIAWFAAFQPQPRGLWLLVGAFIVFGLLDYGLICRSVAPEWYGTLRLALSAGVAVCLTLAALSS